MKKLIYLIILPLLLIACNGGNTPEPPTPPKPTQDYTSFVFKVDIDVVWLKCKAAYLNEDKHIIKIAELGDFRSGVTTKEVKLPDESITEIYLFFYSYLAPRGVETPFKLEKNKKNIFRLKGVLAPYLDNDTDPTIFPQ